VRDGAGGPLQQWGKDVTVQGVEGRGSQTRKGCPFWVAPEPCQTAHCSPTHTFSSVFVHLEFIRATRSGRRNTALIRKTCGQFPGDFLAVLPGPEPGTKVSVCINECVLISWGDPKY
jgi:hypothetical protein